MKKREQVIIGAAGVLLLIIVLFLQIKKIPDGKFHAVFCNVGQGDAIFIKTPTGKKILVDGGPNDLVLDCLNKNIAFWDKNIDLIIVSHPQADHITGVISVLNRFKVGSMVMGEEAGTGVEYRALMGLIKQNNVKVRDGTYGMKMDFGDGVMAKIIWPKEEWLAANLIKNNKVMGASADVNNDYVFNGDVNEASEVVLFSYGQFDVLLTGDADKNIQDSWPDIPESVEILKVPHHGSKSSISEEFMAKIKPKLAVISVGKNTFGHPAKEIIEKLKKMGALVLRTDVDHDIEIVSDGRKWEVR